MGIQRATCGAAAVEPHATRAEPAVIASASCRETIRIVRSSGVIPNPVRNPKSTHVPPAPTPSSAPVAAASGPAVAKR